MLKDRWFLHFVYHHPLGRPLLFLFRARLFSKIMGWIFQSSLSKYLIKPLMSAYSISLESYIIPANGFQNVNDFFIRQTHPDFRYFPSNPSLLGSPADGCLEIFQHISLSQPISVKWYTAQSVDIFWPNIVSFDGGDLLFCRLRFSDYHRFHFFDDGEILSSVWREWPLYSVDQSVLDTGLWIQNKSHLMKIRTKHFGEILWLEVGATNVGSIINHKKQWDIFSRGEEKWYFALGGSAVLILFQKDRIQWSEKLLQRSLEREEYEAVTGGIIWNKI